MLKTEITSPWYVWVLTLNKSYHCVLKQQLTTTNKQASITKPTITIKTIIHHTTCSTQYCPFGLGVYQNEHLEHCELLTSKHFEIILYGWHFPSINTLSDEQPVHTFDVEHE